MLAYLLSAVVQVLFLIKIQVHKDIFLYIFSWHCFTGTLKKSLWAPERKLRDKKKKKNCTYTDIYHV